MNNYRIPVKKVMDGKISWKKTCGKTMCEMGRHKEGLLVAAEYEDGGG